MTNEHNYFEDLAKINVGNYIEQKGQFNYLSWAWAIDQLKRYDHTATWEQKWFKSIDGIELPYALGPNGAFVQVSVTVKGVTHAAIQPVMDFKNKAILNPDAMDVNKALQRCLVKAIGMHGLGLYIYAGEDLPNELITGVQMNTINKKAEEYVSLRGGEGTTEQLLSSIGVGSVQHLTSDQANVVINKLSALVEKAKTLAAKKTSEATEDKEAKQGA